MELKIYNIKIFDSSEMLVDVYTETAQNKKGVEKKRKSEFKTYRTLGYNWSVEEFDQNV